MIINNYEKKKLENRARLTLDPANDKQVKAEELIRDDDTDNEVWFVRDTHTVKHLNNLIDAAVIEKDAFMAAYQPQLDKLNKRIQNLRAIKADTKLLTGDTSAK